MEQTGELKLEYVALSELEKWPRNPKDHDLDLIRKSIRRFGFNDPLAVDEGSRKMVEGHGRVEVLRELKAAGNEPPERILVRADGEWLVPVLKGIRFENAAEAEAYVIGHNRSTEAGGWLNDVLAEIFSDVDDQSLFDVMGFDDLAVEEIIKVRDVTALVASAPAEVVDDPAAEWEGMPEFDQQDKTPFRTLRVHFADQAAVDAFAELTNQKITEATRMLWYPEIEIERYADKHYVDEGGEE